MVFTSVPLIFAAPLPAAPPVNPAPAGAAQVYVVPAGTIPSVTLAGVRLNPPPLQIVAVRSFNTGLGLIVTVTVKSGPATPPLEGVTVYTAVTVAFVVLFSVPLMLAAPDPDAPPVNPAPAGTAQL